MKKSVLLILAFSFFFVLAGADYKVMLLGDLHFDSEQYHIAPNGEKSGNANTIRHSNMWKKQSPEMLANSAKILDKSFPFVIQLGDIVEGYAATTEQLCQMLTDSFYAVKKFYPEHKFLSVKGNHDVRRVITKKVNGSLQNISLWEHDAYNKSFLPLIAKELDRKSLESHFSVSFNNDLYIFYDDFADEQTSVNFLKKTLSDNPSVRHVFFITHIPLLPCSTKKPWNLAPRASEIIKLLADRNAIILAGHTHAASFIKVKVNGKPLTQLVISSLGYLWNKKNAMDIFAEDLKQYLFKLDNIQKQNPKLADVKNYLNTMTVEELIIYNVRSIQGFAMMKVNDDNSVFAEIYNDDSSKPVLVKKLH